jgi:hypothetical protein
LIVGGFGIELGGYEIIKVTITPVNILLPVTISFIYVLQRLQIELNDLKRSYQGYNYELYKIQKITIL